MCKIKLAFIFWFSLAFYSLCFGQDAGQTNGQINGQTKEVAITIDDLPLVGSRSKTPADVQRTHDRFMQIVQTLIDHKVPATGFIIAGSIGKDQWQLLELFRDKGFILGNHTYTHMNLARISAEKYIADVDKADQIIQPLFNGPKYFRYPYLAEGTGAKRQKVYDYLAAHHYIIAPITIDSKDYQFNARVYAIPYRLRPQGLGGLKKRYLAYVQKQILRAEAQAKGQNQTNTKQILLVHSNLLNSYFLGDVLDMFEKNGYKFISLEEALKAPAPIINTPIQQDGPNKDMPADAPAENDETTSLLDSNFIQTLLKIDAPAFKQTNYLLVR
ncbi:polysaccharide deacetylase family protein [Legionella sp. D16C41]|uniref:polysaccharide deacetylase family protein n=1 Tax=Legionella sp. D16C41 TaxID=3402688 RepID=UPI003AF40E9B